MATNLEDRVKELEAKVAELYDREALRDLRYRYHECINEAQTAEIPDLFTEDGELDFAHLGKAKGREQIKKFFSGLGRDRSAPDSRRGLYRVRQFIHNHVLKVTGDHATGYAYLEAKPVYNGESYVVAARYTRRVRKARRTLALQQNESHSILHGPAERRMGGRRSPEDGSLAPKNSRLDRRLPLRKKNFAEN
jgi:hypothetical protein